MAAELEVPIADGTVFGAFSSEIAIIERLRSAPTSTVDGMTTPLEQAARFIRKDIRNRFMLLHQARQRDRKSANKWSRLLSSSGFLDRRVLVNLRLDRQQPTDVVAELKARGALEECVLISENPDLDGRSMSVDAAVPEITGRGYGTILLCSEFLGYYEGEEPNDRYLLVLDRRT